MLGFGVGKHCGGVLDSGDEVFDLVPGEAAGGGGVAEVGFGLEALRFGLADPGADLFGVAACVDGGAVAGHLLVRVGDAGSGRLGCDVIDSAVLGGGDQVNGVRQLAGGEQAGQPVVDVGSEGVLADVDVARVVDLVRQGVLSRESAPVVGGLVDPLALHAALAEAAEDSPGEGVGAADAMGLVLAWSTSPRRQDVLDLAERRGGDDGRVGNLVGVDPLTRFVPAHLAGVAEGDVVDVDKDFVFALAVPDLPTGIAGIDQDGADGALGPGDAAPVRVAGRVVGGRRRDAIGGEPLGYRIQAPAGSEFLEDPADHCGCRFVDRQGMEPLAVCGFGGGGVRPGVGQLVAVGRAPAEEPALELSLSRHGGADPDPDAVPLTLRDSPEHRHDQVVRLIVRVDRPAHFRHPQRHAVMREQRERVAELVTVESSLRLPHDNGIESPARVGQRRQEPTGFRASLGRDRAGLVDVEKLGHDLTAMRLDQAASAGDLPCSR